MQYQGLIVLIANFLLIGTLPVGFFKRDGQFNIMWWLTASPFLVSITSVMATYAGRIRPFVIPSELVSSIAICLSVMSIGLIAFTLGTHRIPIALWHQANDAPQHIVTWGAYSHVRHPFYASFLLAFLAAFLYAPQIITGTCLLLGFIVLNSTAAREEKRLRASEFGTEYQEYMHRTGRFIPRLG